MAVGLGRGVLGGTGETFVANEAPQQGPASVEGFCDLLDDGRLAGVGTVFEYPFPNLATGGLGLNAKYGRAGLATATATLAASEARPPVVKRAREPGA
ncbi:hypothetical protein GCM10027589_13170 [Actinocorallia lasiicapitis]